MTRPRFIGLQAGEVRDRWLGRQSRFDRLALRLILAVAIGGVASVVAQLAGWV